MIATLRPELELRIEEVANEADFLRLRGPWNRLVERVGGNVFQRHEWFTAAWAWCRRTDEAPWIVCAYANERLVGVLPLLRPYPLPNGGRQLQFLSVPDSQWCDALIHPDAAPAIAHLLAGRLVEKASLWDVLRLERLAATSAVNRWLAPALGAKGLAVHLEAVDCNLFVDLESLWCGYQAGLSRSIKKTRNLANNRLSRAGAVQLQWITAETVAREDVQPLLDEAVSISAQSWKRATGNSLDRPGPQAFIRGLTEVAFAERWLSLWFLRIDNQAVAMEYQLVFDGRVHALRADFDDRFAAMSPGTYLNFHMLEKLFNKGDCSRYYMGPGNNPYKTRWSGTGDKVYTMTSFAPTMRGRAGELWWEIKPKLRTLRDRLMP